MKMRKLSIYIVLAVSLLIIGQAVNISAQDVNQTSGEIFIPFVGEGDSVGGAGDELDNEQTSAPTNTPTNTPTSEPTSTPTPAPQTPTVTPTWPPPTITPTSAPTSTPTRDLTRVPFDEQRVLDLASENVEMQTQDSSFGVCYRYGNTKQFYHFIDQNAVVAVSFSFSDTSFEPTISVNLFAEDEAGERIGWWINNQYSDAIYGDAPEPIYVKTLAEGEYTLSEVNYIERVTGPYGQEYADYNVAYTLSDLTVDGQFELMEFTQEALVHIRTKDCALANAVPRQRVLDVSSEETSESTVDQYFSPCLYGPTQQFFNFGSENVVMVVRFGTDDPDFEPTIMINVFSPELSADQIAKWINNQHSDALYADAPIPVFSDTLQPPQYSITSAELINSSTGTAGDEYDNYRVQYAIEEIMGNSDLELIGFDDETVVHIRTKACG